MRCWSGMLSQGGSPIPSMAKVVMVVVGELNLAQPPGALGWLLDGH